MKTKLSCIVFFLLSLVSSAQPQIAGDLILCPEGEGTAYVVNDQNYDSYQWFYKYWFESGDFIEIPGATEGSFTYDWYTYDQALLKVVVTLDGETYESNTIQIDSYAFLPISMGFQDSENIMIAPDSGIVLLCTGTTFDIEVFNPYSANIQWYRNGVPIAEATGMTYEVSAEGTYHVVASPPMCPDLSASTQGTPIIVSMNEECSLSVPEISDFSFSVLPNPASDAISIESSIPVDAVSVYNLSGQLLLRESGIDVIDVSSFASGVYLIKAESARMSQTSRLVKE